MKAASEAAFAFCGATAPAAQRENGRTVRAPVLESKIALKRA
jgi:hypothetical protein